MKMPSIRKLLLKTDYNRRLSMDQYQINFAEIDLSSSSTDRPAQIDGDRSFCRLPMYLSEIDPWKNGE